MTDRGDPFDRLPRGIRTWLDAFSARVDTLRVEELQLLAIGPDGARAAAADRAEQLARRTSRVGAIEAIREVAIDYVARRYSERFHDPRLPFLGGSVALGTGGRERAGLVGSFEDALTAIALSDVLAPDDVDTLLGAWAELADAAAGR